MDFIAAARGVLGKKQSVLLRAEFGKHSSWVQKKKKKAWGRISSRLERKLNNILNRSSCLACPVTRM